MLEGPHILKFLREHKRLLQGAGMCVLLLLLSQKFDLEAIGRSYRGLSAKTGLSVIGLVLAAFVLRLLRWFYQLRLLKIPCQLRETVRGFTLGMLLSAVTPLRAGEWGRLAAIAPGHPSRSRLLALGSAALLLEKGYELLALLGLACGGILIREALWPLLPPLLLGLALALLLAQTRIGLPESWRKRLPKPLLTWLVDPLFEARDSLPFRGRWAMLGLSLLAHLLNLSAGLQIFRLFGELDAFRFFVSMPLLTLLALLPVTLAGVGVRELGAMALFGSPTLDPSGAALASVLLYGTINGLLPLGIWLLASVLPSSSWVWLERLWRSSS